MRQLPQLNDFGSKIQAVQPDLALLQQQVVVGVEVSLVCVLECVPEHRRPDVSKAASP